MRGSLSRIGVIWTGLTLASMFVTVLSFFSEFWLTGTLSNGETTLFNLFRRCNYYLYDINMNKTAYYTGCGQYSTYYDIPNTSWQISIVMAAIGMLLQLFCCLHGLASFFIDYFTRSLAVICGCLQLVAGLALSGSALLFANGITSPALNAVCGPIKHPLHCGEFCSYDWAFWTYISGAASTTLICLLGFHANKETSKELNC